MYGQAVRGESVTWLELRFPPPVVLVICAAAMWGLDHWLPQYSAAIPAANWLASAYISLGIMIAFTGVSAFRRAQTTVDPRSPGRASALVTGGVYRFSRNPMYLGMLFVLLGWFFFLGSLPSPLLAVGFIACITRYQIRPEERFLEERFGDRYLAYCSRTPRWI